MNVLITGTSTGIGRAAAVKFLKEGHTVVGIDINKGTIDDNNYFHFVRDISDKQSLPPITGTNILINNAGVQDESRNIDVNLLGTIYCTEKYGIQPSIKSIVNVVSASAHSGAEFPLYTASKGGVLAYTKNVATRIAQYNATCNSISPGGVITDMNKHIIEDPVLWKAVLNETMLNKWADDEEIAEWIYFISVINKSMTSQDILIDNGEMAKSNFIW